MCTSVTEFTEPLFLGGNQLTTVTVACLGDSRGRAPFTIRSAHVNWNTYRRIYNLFISYMHMIVFWRIVLIIVS